MIKESYLRKEGKKYLIKNEYSENVDELGVNTFIQEISQEEVKWLPNETMYHILRLKGRIEELEKKVKEVKP